MNCEDCKAQSRFTFESAMAMAERTIIRLWIIVILLIVVSIGSNIAWFVYESQFETVEESVETETDILATQFGGGVNIVGGGDVRYGAGSED